MSDIRHSLLRRDALSAAKEVLYHLDIYFSSQLQSAPLPIVDKGPVELLEEFVFQVPKERSAQPKRLNSLQELQLLEIMCNYFQEQTKDSVRQIIFSSLFSPQGNKADDSRMSLLGKLVSMAVAVCRIPVLECAASWLQRTPVVYCVRLAKALVDDYCCLVPGSIQTLKQIFSASPRFCCQFITSVTALYDLSSDDLIPPMDLLEMIVTWIFEDPRLILITFLNTPIAANLPIGFLELTPLVGLIRWCVKAPLAYKRKKKPPLSNGHVSNKVTKDPGVGMDRDSHLLYSKLHLSVLQVLMTLQLHLTEKNLYGRLGLILFDHMVPLVEEINRLADELNPLNASQEIELSLDRLAQALQVAMASGALLCTRDDLRTLCSRLPHNNREPQRLTWRPPVWAARPGVLRLELRGPQALCRARSHASSPVRSWLCHCCSASTAWTLGWSVPVLLQLVISGPVQQSPHAALPPGFYPHIHTPPLGYGAVPAHPAAHPALPTHPGHTFISGVTFPFRPIR
ncbi:integrator complex subunit 15 isoform X2 [Symphalangus syndactylus]|uniref:integrator complex subunit 15 isoform X2 n=1 Tax=Symphalangus syndactylus TaxID=9590 RepID=UPI0024426DA8|nr:integrator complex subunit 15 isoform X3 [Symphalangus syndactylus]